LDAKKQQRKMQKDALRKVAADRDRDRCFDESTVEIEAKFLGSLTKRDVARLTYWLSTTENVQELAAVDSLDLLSQAGDATVLRRTYLGKDAIHDHLHRAPDLCIRKRRELDTIVTLHDFTVRRSVETPVGDEESNPTDVDLYRLKRRRSFLLPAVRDGLLRVDVSVVKTSRVSAEDAARSAAPLYELEVEATRPMTTDQDLAAFEDALKTLRYGASSPLTVGIPVGPDVRRRVIGMYLDLVVQGGGDVSEAMQAPRKHFVGPHPVTLEREGVPMIHHIPYTVTDKADGDRCLLMTTDQGETWLIDSALRVRYTTLNHTSHRGSLLDGELVMAKDGQTWMYAAFDAYFENGKDIRHEPHVPSRLEAARRVLNDTIGMKTVVKTFRPAADCKGLWDTLSKNHEAALPYAVDGLIFTPAALPADKDAIVYKWKPGKHCTIDLRVDLGCQVDVTTNGDGRKMRVATLRVGRNPRMAPLRVSDAWGGGGALADVVRDRSSRGYEEAVFAVVDLPMDGHGRVWTEDHSDIVCDGDVVEFRFSAGRDSSTAVPIRIRRDKMQAGAGANDIATAQSVLRAMQRPVSLSYIETGECPPHDDTDTNISGDKYYQRPSKRVDLGVRAMADFHCHGIKDEILYARARRHGANLLELACGKAGDLPRWLKHDFDKVVGVDVNRDCIENPTDGAYARLLSRGAPVERFAFLVADAGWKFTPERFRPRSAACLHFWGFEKFADQFREEAFGFASDRFEVVSCMMAVHYFFESERALDAFVYNVAQHLRPGGVFIGTCMDAASVMTRLQSSSSTAVGRCQRTGRVLWKLSRVSSSANVTGCGQALEVFIESIGHPVREYLVDFELLAAKLASYGLVDVTPAWAHESRCDGCSPLFSAASTCPNLRERMSAAEAELSGMFRWFAFEKVSRI
jgi:SAM-dependent methyltransferase